MNRKIMLADKGHCTGCSACYSVCPQKAIRMAANDEGFLFPIIANDFCIKCHLCEKVCAVINNNGNCSNEDISVYAAYNSNNDIRSNSSSGGIFYLLSEWILQQGGVVFGVKWSEQWLPVHDYAKTIDELPQFMGSKYMQSEIGDAYKNAKAFLDSGRLVLFSGTPCQISGLKKFLCKNYDNLYAVEVLCLGVPSPKVWGKYLKEMKGQLKIDKIKAISFRDKSNGWSHSSFRIDSIDHTAVEQSFTIPNSNNLFFIGLDKCAFFRKSCYNCTHRSLETDSDITIGDCWNVNETCPSLFDDKGISTVICKTPKGQRLFYCISNKIVFCEDNKDLISQRISSQLEPRLNRGLIRRSDFFFYQHFFKFNSRVTRSVFINDKPYIRLIRRVKKIFNI